MSIKTTLTNPPTIALIALQIIGGLLILASIVGFRSGGMLWPMLGSGAGTCLVEAGGSLTCFAGGNEIMSKYPLGVWEDYAGTLHFDIAALRDETVRGYEVSKGQYVKVEDAEQLLSRARRRGKQTVPLARRYDGENRPPGNQWATWHQTEGG
jgi:hypothetical protein